MIPRTFIDYYGDQTRWFIGEVINVADDPLQLGRAQVRAFGVYDDIEDKDLPWAQVVIPITTGIHEGKGQNLGMLVGTQVFGIFLDGQDSQLPMIIGSIPKEGDTNKKAEDNYPLNKVYETETGHYKEYDDSGTGRIREQHTKGTYYEMKEDGIHIYGEAKVTIHGKDVVKVIAPSVEVTGDVVKLNS